jgi:hypothetical protein
MSGAVGSGRLVADFEDSATGLNHPVCTAVIPAQPAISTNTWHHAAATYDGTCWKLYLDGVSLTLIPPARHARAARAFPPAPAWSPEPNSPALRPGTLEFFGAPAANSRPRISKDSSTKPASERQMLTAAEIPRHESAHRRTARLLGFRTSRGQ